MNVKIKLNDVQLDKRYLVNVEDTSAPKSNRNRRHFSLSGILGSDVKSMLEEDPNLGHEIKISVGWGENYAPSKSEIEEKITALKSEIKYFEDLLK